MFLMLICGAAVMIGLALAWKWGAVEPLPRAIGLDDRMKTHSPIVARLFATATRHTS